MISTSPLVSVVLPLYNHQRFVREALDSVFQQTYPRIELIVVDDGSQDESLAIVHRRLPHSPYPYHILQQPNQGAYGAINNGIKASGGKYLAILNSDDLYHPDRIMRMVRALEGKPYSKHVGPKLYVVDSNNVNTFDRDSSLAPDSFKSTFTVK